MITIEDVRQAAARIQGSVHRTPVLTSHLLDQRAGVSCFFKCENFQRGGAFKIRGAANFLLSVPKQDIGRGVVAFSSGNHAQAVAIAARDLGVSATIVMPTDAPAAKLEATRNYGAKVVQYDRLTEDRQAIGESIAIETGATLVPPYDHAWTMTGQGTAALELLEEVPDLDALAICLGGGGLFSGCSVVAHGINSKLRLFGVEPEKGNDFYLSMQAGERVEIPLPDTIADGLRAPKPGALTFPVVREHAEKVILVSDDEIRETMQFLASRMKIVVEPSGATAAAAVLHRKLPEGISRCGIIISGGNL
jgi:threonine dehydratase